MKFQPDTAPGINLITRLDPGRVWVGSTPFTTSLLLPWVGAVLPWQASRFEDLGAAHFERIAALQPEVVIFGSGARLRFPPPAWLASLMNQRIGVETMDSAAAARTYNVLASEGRSALLALLLEN
jgi:uncharacterized protein